MCSADPKKDHIGVFISIVSTKIPYKGTSKEYIGADITEIHKAVKSAIQQCGLQLKIQLNLSLKAKHDYERKRTLTKYIPNICSALLGVMSLIKEDSVASASASAAAKRKAGDASGDTLSFGDRIRNAKRVKREDMLKHLDNGQCGCDFLLAFCLLIPFVALF